MQDISTLDFSNPSFNPQNCQPTLVEMSWVKKSWLKMVEKSLKSLGIKLVVEISCNQYYILSNLRKAEENLPLRISMLYLWESLDVRIGEEAEL